MAFSIEQILLIISSAILGLLGFMHLVYTLFSNKFDTWDPDVKTAMQNTSPIITKQTTVWKAWIGFNVSHSVGAMLMAAFYIPLSVHHMPVIQTGLWFAWLPVVIGCSYLLMAHRYWFHLPFYGISLATLGYVAAAVLMWVE